MEKKSVRLLILSFYYQPDLSAGSFRTVALVHALKQRYGPEIEIDIVTTLPNRYRSFAYEAPQHERADGVSIHRIALPAHDSGMCDQARAYLTFSFRALKLIRNESFDAVYATSSRLMTAALGALIARKRRIPLYLDIRDIFVDTLRDILSRKIAWLACTCFSLVEKFTVRAAARVNLVSAGFLPYFRERYPDTSFCVHTNGIDEIFMDRGEDVVLPASAVAGRHIHTYTVVYAGNIGEGQGLHRILPSLAQKFAGRLNFLVVGDGGRREKLVQEIAARGIDNIEIRPPVKRDELIRIYRGADILFVHLNDVDAFRKVLPSKLFEYAALGKPLWAGVAGYAAQFTLEHIENAQVFAPCDAEDAERVFRRLEMRSLPRTDFIRRFSRQAIMDALAQDLVFYISRQASS